MARHDDLRQRLEALKLAVQRKVGPLGRLDDEQRAWLAEWRQQQPFIDYETRMNNADHDADSGMRSDIKRVLHGDVPQILATDTDDQANDKYTIYIGRSR